MERSVMMIARKEVRTEVLTSFLSDSHQHQQRPAHDEEQANEGFSGERFMKDHIGKNDGDQDAPVAMPDRRKHQVLPLTAAKLWSAPVTSTMSQENTSTTMVRRAVATLESVCLMPHLARMEVNPANRAEPKAYAIHIC